MVASSSQVHREPLKAHGRGPMHRLCAYALSPLPGPVHPSRCSCRRACPTGARRPRHPPRSAPCPSSASPRLPAKQTDHSPRRLSRRPPRTVVDDGVVVVGGIWQTGSADEQVAVQVRQRAAGRWSDWEPIDVEAAADTGERGSRAGTELYVVVGADRVQMRMEGAHGQIPSGAAWRSPSPASRQPTLPWSTARRVRLCSGSTADHTDRRGLGCGRVPASRHPLLQQRTSSRRPSHSRLEHPYGRVGRAPGGRGGRRDAGRRLEALAARCLRHVADHARRQYHPDSGGTPRPRTDRLSRQGVLRA